MRRHKLESGGQKLQCLAQLINRQSLLTAHGNHLECCCRSLLTGCFQFTNGSLVGLHNLLPLMRRDCFKDWVGSHACLHFLPAGLGCDGRIGRLQEPQEGFGGSLALPLQAMQAAIRAVHRQQALQALPYAYEMKSSCVLHNGRAD